MNLLVVNRMINHQNIHIVADNRVRKRKPVIYACTHIGYSDVVIAFSAIKKPCWLFMGNPEVNCRTMDGWLAEKNGVIYVDTKDKKDRKMVKLTAIRFVKQGGSLLIFPEAAWNITENEIVMRIFKGTVDIAMESGADVVPIAIEQYGKDFYVNIGKNISYTDSFKDSQELTLELRDNLATLKWEIWEKMGITKRSTIPSDYKEKFIDNILSEAQYRITLEAIENQKFIDKSITDYETAFAFVKTLPVKKETAFLFRRT